jgi:hypothetical protein
MNRPQAAPALARGRRDGGHYVVDRSTDEDRGGSLSCFLAPTRALNWCRLARTADGEGPYDKRVKGAPDMQKQRRLPVSCRVYSNRVDGRL